MTALVDTSGATRASYEYSPFGVLLRCEGEAARANPIRFSTKYTDDETGLLYYGYRYYSPTLGRWISKDPLEEEGGVNLYGFVENNSANAFDLLGMTSSADVGTGSSGAASLDAGGAGQALSLKARFERVTNAMTDFYDIVELVMDSSAGDPTELLEQIWNKRGEIFELAKTDQLEGDILHHSVPQQQRGRLGKTFDVDRFAVGLQEKLHQKLHKRKGFGRGGIWNGLWNLYMGGAPNKNSKTWKQDMESMKRSKEDIEKFARRMGELFGLPGQGTWTPYK